MEDIIEQQNLAENKSQNPETQLDESKAETTVAAELPDTSENAVSEENKNNEPHSPRPEEKEMDEEKNNSMKSEEEPTKEDNNVLSNQVQPQEHTNRRRIKRDRKRPRGFDVAPVGFETAKKPELGSALASIASTATSSVNRRIYVGSINFEVTQADIRTVFAPFGEILDITMPIDPLTTKHKGYCFIEYISEEAANNALTAMNGFLLAGRPIKVGRPNAGAVMTNPLLPALNPSIVANLNPTASAGLLAATPTATATAVPSGASATLLAAQIAQNLTSASVAAGLVKTTTTPSGAVIPSGPNPEKPSRLYVGSVHWDITEADIRSVFEAFGPISNCQLLPNPETGKHKGYGFIEYMQPESAQEAHKAMQNFNLGGRQLKVGWASGPALPYGPTGVAAPSQLLAQAQAQAQALLQAQLATTTATASPVTPVLTSAALAAAQAAAAAAQGGKTMGGDKPLATREGTLASEEGLSISGVNQRLELMNRLERKTESSRVLLLRNMVSIAEVDEELEEEVAEECTKYGPVVKVVIMEVDGFKETEAETAVKIFVQFSKPEHCRAALTALDQRWFGGRVVRAALYDENKFFQNDLSG